MMGVGGDEMRQPALDYPLRRLQRVTPETAGQTGRVDLRERAALDHVSQHRGSLLKFLVAFRVGYDRNDARLQNLEYRHIYVRRY
jgi:hypothetical protein